MVEKNEKLEYSRRRNIGSPNIGSFFNFSRNFKKSVLYWDPSAEGISRKWAGFFRFLVLHLAPK